MGNGSDEVLAHIWLSLLANRPVQTLDTTYGFYPVWAQLYHSILTEVPVLTDFSVDVDALMASEQAVVLANPNAPTGLALNRQEIERLLAGNSNRLHIIDEAYYGFGADTVAPLIDQYDNLIVSRSLSKSHALAGLRVGYALAHRDLIEGLNRVKDSFNSYPLDAVAQAAAKAAICDDSWQAQSAALITESRSKMTGGLEALGLKYCLRSPICLHPTPRFIGAHRIRWAQAERYFGASVGQAANRQLAADYGWYAGAGRRFISGLRRVVPP